MSEPLSVRLSGIEIGGLLPDGSLEWVSGWEDLAPLNSRALSCSIPFGTKAADPAPFFGGLLPEGIGLDRLAREAGVASNDLYGLLAEVGADVGGSVTIGEPRPPVDPLEIVETEYEAILAKAQGYLRGSTVGGGGSSATGVQAKIALTRYAATDPWLIGRGSTPSTHILKPVPHEHGARIRSEAALNDLARSLGLSNHDAWVESAGERDVLIVERYDRVRQASNAIDRVHQEDAAQALGLPWGGNDKYESVNQRAKLRNLAGLLRRAGSVFGAGGSEREQLLALVTLQVLSGNTDAHAKNYSLMLPPLAAGSSGASVGIALADAYDVVPQKFFAPVPDPLAMSVNDVFDSSRVTAGDLVAEGTSWGIRASDATRVVERVLSDAGQHIERLGLGHGAPESLGAFMLEQIGNLLRGDAAWTRKLPVSISFPQVPRNG